MKLDAKRREYDIVVIGEEAHLAYNRVGLTSFFQHRKVENLYLNPKEWVHYSLKHQSSANLDSTPMSQKGLLTTTSTQKSHRLTLPIRPSQRVPAKKSHMIS